VAERFDASILSVDSMQVYRDMDIGTAKPSEVVRRRITHHMVDIADPAEDFSVQRFQAIGRPILEAEIAANRRVVIAGGSGLHLRCLVDPLTFAPTDPDVRDRLEREDVALLRVQLLERDPHAADHTDLANPRRVVRAMEVLELTGETPSDRARTPEAAALASYEPEVPFLAIGVDAGEDLRDRVDGRLHGMVERGLLDEVAGLQGRLGMTAAQAVGYKEFLPVVNGERPFDGAFEDAARATRALAKRQRTFFRRDPRIAWLPWQDEERDRIAQAIATIGERAAWIS
jgi:tRNA dimethylallyltransferase